MISYLVSSKNKTIIYEDLNKIIVNKNIKTVINDLCKIRLFTHSGYNEAIKDRFGQLSLIPLYLDKEHLLIPLGNDNNEKIWINKLAIENISSIDNLSIITLVNKETIISSKNIKYFNKQYILLDKIKLFKKNL